MTTDHEKLRIKQARAELWRRGNLDFLLDDTQLEMKRAWQNSDQRKFIILCSRRIGKSYFLCHQAVEAALKAKVKCFYLTATQKDCRDIVRPLMDKILEDCPPSLKPKFLRQDSRYVFKNGSEILLWGVDKNPDGPRGQEGQLLVLDEAGFIDHLDYLVSSVLVPMTMTTGGRILFGTTPPKQLDHPFIKFLAEAQTTGAFIKKTIYDNPRVTPKQIAEYMAEAGGENSPDWRREYLCEILQDAEMSVIPEFSAVEKEIIREVERPPWADRYVSMDLGFTDDTGLVFGWWDFQNAALIIEDELVVQRETSRVIAAKINDVEGRLWGDNIPYKRIADHNNPQLIYDLNSMHGVSFGLANKEIGKEPMINRLRLMVANKQIIIHPRCKNLIMQMRFARWKDAGKTTFVRSEQFGHFDLVDALIMMANSLNRNRNPVPVHYDRHTQYVQNVRKESHPLTKMMPTRTSKIIRRR